MCRDLTLPSKPPKPPQAYCCSASQEILRQVISYQFKRILGWNHAGLTTIICNANTSLLFIIVG